MELDYFEPFNSNSYIPPCWAHRTVNIGDEPLIFFGVYRGDAGHDYGIIELVHQSPFIF